MKNGINTGQFRVKTGSRGNGRKTPLHFRKYGNRTPQIRKQTDKSEKQNRSEREFFRPFSMLAAFSMARYTGEGAVQITMHLSPTVNNYN
jgi:hypothetical protein